MCAMPWTHPVPGLLPRQDFQSALSSLGSTTQVWSGQFWGQLWTHPLASWSVYGQFLHVPDRGEQERVPWRETLTWWCASKYLTTSSLGKAG